MNELQRLESKCVNYLKNHTSYKKPVSMPRLALILGVSERMVRKVIENIILSEQLIIGNINGYWKAETKEEIELANKLLVSRTKASIERLIANGADIDFIFGFTQKLIRDNSKVSEGQISIYEQ